VKAGPPWQSQNVASCAATGGPRRGNHILQRESPRSASHAAALPLRQGIHPKIVAEMLGHSTVSMTLDTYSHVLPDMQKDATAAFDRLLGE